VTCGTDRVAGPELGATERLLEAFRLAIEQALAAGLDGEVRAVAMVRAGELRDGHIEPARLYPLRGLTGVVT
jgi:hypothetical protein